MLNIWPLIYKIMFNSNESKLSFKTFKGKIEETCDKDSIVDAKKSNETYGLADWELGN